MLPAQAAVGLWSQYGVDEVRDRFLKAYQDGKDFAKRMTFWDFMFGVGGRDEEAYVTLLRWLGQIMLNFTVGLCSALVSFGFSLASMIWEYKASCRLPPDQTRICFPACILPLLTTYAACLWCRQTSRGSSSFSSPCRVRRPWSQRSSVACTGPRSEASTPLPSPPARMHASVANSSVRGCAIGSMRTTIDALLAT